MNEPAPKLPQHLRWIMVVSLVEVPFLILGGVLFALGDEPMRMVGIGVVALTAVGGSAAIALGMRNAHRDKR